MPKLPRDLSAGDVERALRRLGFQFIHARGHNVWARGDRTVTVPRHRVIKLGTLREIIRQAGLNLGEFLAAL
ncbi:MAG: type II toxin-antitoxin system HicA family toxin [Planctomycetes bacterium]|nr:type II toxin-antitoxin system HicA family toxin [Planctomycetota bacterium]